MARSLRIGVLLMIVCSAVLKASPANATVMTLTSDRAAPQPVGTIVRWTTTASGGTAPYSFKWWLYDGATWILLGDWTTSTSFEWSPTAANSAYRIGVWVRSAGNNADVDESNAAAYFAITAASATASPSRASAATLVADRAAPQPPGSTITWTVQPTGGVAPLSYKWWLYDGSSWRLLRDWSTAATYAWTPAAENSAYRIGVWVRSAGNTADIDETNQAAYFAIAPAPKVSGVTLTPDRTAPQPAGTPVVWTATATGGATPISYKWWVDDGLRWTALTDWTTSNVVAWTPAEPNEAFRIGVWARSAASTADIDESNMSQTFPVRGGVPDCLQPLDPSVVTIPSGGGTGSVQISPAEPGCAWSVRSQATWISITTTPNATGEATVGFSVSPNVDPVSRTGFVMVGAKAFSVTQGGASTSAGCSYAVFPTALHAGFGNGSTTVAVTAPAGCAWSASASGFVSVSPTAGVGSATLSISIENNTAPESRGAVLTIAGRAVTLTQAGHAANPQGCTYSVTPGEATFDFRAANGTAVVSAPSGCAWSAAAASGFVHLTGATSGSGSGTVSYVIDTNGAGTSRSGLLMIAGEAVKLEQSAIGAAPPCIYTLSASSASMSYAGGSGAVSVSTTGECQWSVASHTSWIHVIDSTGPSGAGNVWYSVDANSGSARAGTLVVAGQTLIISQGEPPTSADGANITWTTQPDPQRVGNCSGNCGAGCGTFFNPCGGPHYWEHTVVSAPQYVGDDWEPVCTESSSWFVVRPRYTALTRWTYHGLKSQKCEEHDATCRNLNLIPFVPLDKALCLATAGLVGLNGLNYCDGATPFDWSYDVVDVGHGAPVAFVDGVPSCN